MFILSISPKSHAPLFFALAALGILLLALEVARPCCFLHDDNATWFAAAYAHDFRVLTETGRIAEVNFYQYGGEPFLGQGQTAVLYPPVYLGEALAKFIPGDLRWSIEWIAAIHLAFGVAGFYFWLRQSGVEAPLAALGGLAWALNPFVLLLGASWIMVTYVVAWLPWLFWAIDRLLAGAWPSLSRALVLGTILGLFALQGYVQWVVYAALFAGLYTLYLLATRRDPVRSAAGLPLQCEPPWPVAIFLLVIAGLVSLAWTLPLLLPMAAATEASAARAKMLSLAQILAYRVQAGDLFAAQFGIFRPGFMFGLSSAIFFCPALLLLPFAVVSFFRGDAALRRRLFPLIVLAGLALVLSTWGHVLLDILPFMQKFRWPFKVFLFAEFFLLAAFVRGLASLFPRRKYFAVAGLSVVLAAQLAVALTEHDTNFISKTTLPTSDDPLPPGMDPTQGRVVAIDDHLPELDSYRYFTHCYGTYYQVPSLGGYDPLVSRDSLQFGAHLDFPNFFSAPMDDHARHLLESRAVRYWIVDPKARQRAELGSMAGLKLLAAEPDRLIYEDTNAEPIAYADSAPAVPLPLRYSGNSMLVRLDSTDGLVEISLGPAKGWWYRLDAGPWSRADYRDDRLVVPVLRSARVLEISFFDPQLNGIWLIELQLITIMGFISWLFVRLRHRALLEG
jgi:hypothetical protein